MRLTLRRRLALDRTFGVVVAARINVGAVQRRERATNVIQRANDASTRISTIAELAAISIDFISKN